MMNRGGQGFQGRGMMGRGGQGFQGRGMGRPGPGMPPPPDVARPDPPMPPEDEDVVRLMPPMQRRGMGRWGQGRGMTGGWGRGMGRPGPGMAPPPDVARPGPPMPPEDEDAVRPMPPMQRRGMGRRGRDLPEPEAIEPGPRGSGRRVD